MKPAREPHKSLYLPVKNSGRNTKIHISPGTEQRDSQWIPGSDACLAGAMMMDNEWVTAFGSKAGPPLKEIFESELGALPEPLAKLLQQLHESEQLVLAAA